MGENASGSDVEGLRRVLREGSPSARLQAALHAGTNPTPDYLDVLVRRCAVEPDRLVADTLTWALTRLDPEQTVPALLAELVSPFPQARSQALHTLSKIGDARAWPHFTSTLLRDEEVVVARAAWRTAAGLVPRGQEAGLAVELATQLGRGGRETRARLSRALQTLGDAARPALEQAAASPDAGRSGHALATLALLADPDRSFDTALAEARRVLARRAGPGAGD